MKIVGTKFRWHPIDGASMHIEIVTPASDRLLLADCHLLARKTVKLGQHIEPYFREVRGLADRGATIDLVVTRADGTTTRTRF